MDTFTPWTIVVDLGIISALMLLGKLIRVKVKGIQRFLIPPAVLAGIMGLVLGPEVLGWLPLSGSLGTYAGILIAFVFAALPFTLSVGLLAVKAFVKLTAMIPPGVSTVLVMLTVLAGVAPAVEHSP